MSGYFHDMMPLLPLCNELKVNRRVRSCQITECQAIAIDTSAVRTNLESVMHSSKATSADCQCPENSSDSHCVVTICHYLAMFEVELLHSFLAS